MPKGYWVAQGDVSDLEKYKAYGALNGRAFEKYGAKFLVRGGQSSTVEGATRARVAVLEFKDYETALACYNSPEYQEAREKRIGAAMLDIVVIEGWNGPQPGDS